MFSNQMRQFMRLERLLSGALGVLFGLLLSIFSDWLSQQQKTSLIWGLIGVGVILSIILFIYRWRHPFTDIDVAIRTPRIIRSEEQRQRYARRGFVGFVPLYRPNRTSPANKLSSDELQTAIKTRDLDVLAIEHSNLFPTIRAIMQHAGKLDYCWLLTTGKAGETSSGSALCAPILEKYLKKQPALKECTFFTGSAFNIPLDDDALVLNNTFDQIRAVFEHATRLGLTPRDIIVDFSTGVRSMALGMILACLNGDRDLEFMGTHYDETGRPKPDNLFPIIFSFAPETSSD